jgi:hypothetical protein
MFRKKEGAKKKREEVYSRGEAAPSNFREVGNTIIVSGKRLRPRSGRGSAEASDLGGDTGTSSDDDVEDETYQGQFEVRRHK